MRYNGTAWTSNELTSTSGNPIYYRGAPFIVSAAYAQAALSVLAGGSAMFSDVTVHVSRNSFTAPITSVIQDTPKPVGIISSANSSGVNRAIKYLCDSGATYALSGSTACSSGNGLTYVLLGVKSNGTFSNFTAPSVLLPANGASCSV